MESGTFWQSLNGADCQDGWGKLITINAFSFHFISKSGEIFPKILPDNHVFESLAARRLQLAPFLI